MSVYSRAEPKGLGDRPDTILRVLQVVKAHRTIAFLAYAPFRTTVHVIDGAKKAALGICTAHVQGDHETTYTDDPELSCLILLIHLMKDPQVK